MTDPARRRWLLAALALPAVPAFAQAHAPDLPRRLATHYPAAAATGYVNALILSAQRTLQGGQLPPASQAALQAQRDAAPAQPPADWPQRAGYAAFAEAARYDGDVAAQALALQALRTAVQDGPAGPRLLGLRPWTDDLFMPALLFDRGLPLLPAGERPRAAEALGQSLLALAAQLQRADGLFAHAEGSPIAWGRGNGFAALGLAVALGHAVPTGSAPGAALLRRLQAWAHAVLPLQGPDGRWRQVLDQPQSPPELTVTAMTVQALARARERGWLPAGEADAALARGWAAVQRGVDAAAGQFTDVCASTPAGPTLDFYLQRPLLQGRDDRAAALVLQVSLEMQA